MLKYTFKELAVFKGREKADPQKIGEALAHIAEKNGGSLTPSATVEEAQAPAHALHQHFEWDDKVAAHAHRLDQARGLIRSIVVQETPTEEPVHAFLSIADTGGVSYRTVQAVKRSRELQAVVLRQAERDLRSFEQRYKELDTICELVREARELVVKRRAINESRVAG